MRSLSPFTESNRRPSPYHGDALPTELKGRAEERDYTVSRPDVKSGKKCLAGPSFRPEKHTGSRECFRPVLALIPDPRGVRRAEYRYDVGDEGLDAGPVLLVR